MPILRVLTSYQLPCGCLVGVYELYNNEVVSIIDQTAEGCDNADHSTGKHVEGPRARRESL